MRRSGRATTWHRRSACRSLRVVRHIGGRAAHRPMRWGLILFSPRGDPEVLDEPEPQCWKGSIRRTFAGARGLRCLRRNLPTFMTGPVLTPRNPRSAYGRR